MCHLCLRLYLADSDGDDDDDDDDDDADVLYIACVEISSARYIYRW